MTSPRKAQTTTYSASDAEWAEAVRREAVLRPLSTQATLAPLEVKTAAHDLSLSRASVYKLLRVFRGNPVTASLLPRKPGPAKGTRLLDKATEAQITSSIEAAYLKRERPTLKSVSVPPAFSADWAVEYSPIWRGGGSPVSPALWGAARQ